MQTAQKQNADWAIPRLLGPLAPSPQWGSCDSSLSKAGDAGFRFEGPLTAVKSWSKAEGERLLVLTADKRGRKRQQPDADVRRYRQLSPGLPRLPGPAVRRLQSAGTYSPETLPTQIQRLAYSERVSKCE